MVTVSTNNDIIIDLLSCPSAKLRNMPSTTSIAEQNPIFWIVIPKEKRPTLNCIFCLNNFGLFSFISASIVLINFKYFKF